MSDFLSRMADLQHARVVKAKTCVPVQLLQDQIEAQKKPLGFAAALHTHSPGIIAEIKFTSPSAGRIYTGDLSAPEIAQRYQAAGAAALSVLTESQYFEGAPEILRAVRQAVPNIPVLRKDFIVDPYQLLEARAWGADAVLLIVAMLDMGQLSDLYAQAKQLGLDVLIEVHDAAELAQAHAIGAHLIGINNRNLKTLKVDLNTAHDLAAQFKPACAYVAESGIEDPGTIKTLQTAGYSAFLIGSHFMRHPDPGVPLADLVHACA